MRTYPFGDRIAAQAIIEAQQASFNVREALRLMVLETEDQRAPVASEQGPRFQRLAADAAAHLERLVQATRQIERFAVAGLGDEDAKALHLQFERARREKDINTLVALVERIAAR
jgi:hypothetical protein